MRRFDQVGSVGALLLGLALLGYAIYELALWPNAGFPTTDIAVIVAGAPTLRIGHWLKFVDAISLALLTVALHARLRDDAPVLAQLAAVAGAGAATLFLASGMLGLRILSVAEYTLPIRPMEAEVTVFLRTVTVALFDSAASAAGAWGLLVSVAGAQSRRLPQGIALSGVLFGVLFLVNPALPEAALYGAAILAIAWALGLAVVLGRGAPDAERSAAMRASITTLRES